jgi:DNA ligase (NAD+)
MKYINAGDFSDLENIKGIGGSIVTDIHDFFHNENNVNVVTELAQIVSITDVERAQLGILSGKTVVFTGTLNRLSRDEAKELAEQNGARVSSSVSQKTSLVVAGENAGKKLEDARKFGVEIISEDDFLKITRTQFL